MSKKIDLTNKRFGRLLVLKEGIKRNNKITWICKCDCGITKIILGEHLTRTKQSVKSCGCLKLETTSKISRKYNIFNHFDDFILCKTNNGKYYIIDVEDYGIVKDFCWRFKQENSPYIITSVSRSMSVKYPYLKYKQVIYLHRFIMGCYEFPNEYLIDHASTHTLDNRKQNLRMCNTAENAWNTIKTTAIFRGINICKNGDYRVRISKNKEIFELGKYDDVKDAIEARVEAEQEMYKSFAPIRELEERIRNNG